MPRAAEFAKVPAISSSPASGLSRPATQRKVVVLPQPLGPSRTQNSFSVTSRSIPRSASTRPRRLSNHFLSPRMLIKLESLELVECWDIGRLGALLFSVPIQTHYPIVKSQSSEHQPPTQQKVLAARPTQRLAAPSHCPKIAIR